MKRFTVAALAAATLISATAIAGTLAQVETSSSTRNGWYADEANSLEYVPANFEFGGQAPVAFVLP
jgi:hypothetical protein